MTCLARRLPSLNQLRAFEAAARHESIKLGAEELCVTPAAVGHQIKALEFSLNTQLFHRKTRRIVLTDRRKSRHCTRFSRGAFRSSWMPISPVS